MPNGRLEKDVAFRVKFIDVGREAHRGLGRSKLWYWDENHHRSSIVVHVCLPEWCENDNVRWPSSFLCNFFCHRTEGFRHVFYHVDVICPQRAPVVARRLEVVVNGGCLYFHFSCHLFVHDRVYRSVRVFGVSVDSPSAVGQASAGNSVVGVRPV